MLQLHLDARLLDAIAQLHASPWRGNLEEAGTGSWCQSLLQAVPGASNTLHEAFARYAREAQVEHYGDQGRSISRTTVEHWARSNLAAETPFFSLAVSGSVSTEKQRGDNHAWIALALSNGQGWSLHVRLKSPERLAQQQSIGLLNLHLLHQLAQFNALRLEALPLQLQERLEIDVWQAWHDSFERDALNAIELVHQGWTPLVVFQPGPETLRPVRYLSQIRNQRLLLAKGSFNPLTQAHLEMVQSVLQRDQDLLPMLEISLTNADKGVADRHNLRHRLAMLAHQPWPVALSQATALYSARELFQEHCQAEAVDFVCGDDLYRRLFWAKYYQDLPGGLQAGLERLFQEGTRLWVCERDNDTDFPPEAQAAAANYQEQIQHLPLDMPMASSQIRAQIAEQERQAWAHLVPKGVAEYIRKQQLYVRV